jgi:hypothetical protein
MPQPSDPPDVAGQPRINEDDDTGPLRRLSLAVLLALALEIGLLAWLGKAAL